MNTYRPYISKNSSELNAIFEAKKSDNMELMQLLNELKHRTTPSAVTLRGKVNASILSLKTESTSSAQKSPTYQRIKCRNCESYLRIPVKGRRVLTSCPSCKTEFEVLCESRVIQVTWVEKSQATPKEQEGMSESVARELLGLDLSAGFADIKTAWRRASQQYHPDKHQELPDRLRKAAAYEMQRINAAYQYLERAKPTLS